MKDRIPFLTFTTVDTGKSGKVQVLEVAGSKSRQGLENFVWTTIPDSVSIGILVNDPFMRIGQL